MTSRPKLIYVLRELTKMPLPTCERERLDTNLGFWGVLSLNLQMGTPVPHMHTSTFFLKPLFLIFVSFFLSPSFSSLSNHSISSNFKLRHTHNHLDRTKASGKSNIVP